MAMGQNPGTPLNTQKAFQKDNSGVVTIPILGNLGFDPHCWALQMVRCLSLHVPMASFVPSNSLSPPLALALKGAHE